MPRSRSGDDPTSIMAVASEYSACSLMPRSGCGDGTYLDHFRDYLTEFRKAWISLRSILPVVAPPGLGIVAGWVLR